MFSPGQIFLGDGGSRGGMYMPRQSISSQSQTQQTQTQPQATSVGAQAVRPTGGGPFDPSYRQNLASYAGGTLARPGGSLQFDPTGSLFGPGTGTGTAPVPGMPTTLLSQALGMAPAAPTGQSQNPLTNWLSAYGM